MRRKPKPRKPGDRQVISQVQFRTSAGAMRDKRLDSKTRLMKIRLEQNRAPLRIGES